LEAVRLAAESLRSGGDANGSGILRAAKLAQADAEDNADTANAALKTLKAEIAGVENDLTEADVGINMAVNQMLVPHVEAALEAVRKLDALMAPHYALLRFALGHYNNIVRRMNGDSTRELTTHNAENAPLAAVRDQINKFFGARGEAMRNREPLRPWQSVVEELRTDPDAKLPLQS
jgi:hypothetical protein